MSGVTTSVFKCILQNQLETSLYLIQKQGVPNSVQKFIHIGASVLLLSEESRQQITGLVFRDLEWHGLRFIAQSL